MADTYIFGQMLLKVFNKEIDLDSDTIKCMLVYDSATINQHSSEYISELDSFEVSGDGYDAGGQTVSNVNTSYSAPTMTVSGDNLAWTSSTFSTRYGIVYVDTGLTTTSPVLCYVDFDSNQNVNNATFEIEWNADGIFTATV